MIIVGVIGLIMEQLLFKPMRDNPLGGLIMSVGVLFILQVLAAVIFGVGLMKHIPPLYSGGDSGVRHGRRLGAVAAARRLRDRGFCC